MSQIANIKTVHTALASHEMLKTDTREKQLGECVAYARKRGFGVHRDGRLYVPEANRGRGVGYGRHGRG